MKPTYEELEAQVKQLAAERDAVVAENVALKDVVKGVYPNLAIDVSTETVLASLRAEARKQGAIFAANRMLAAWDAGFVDDTPENAADIARAILSMTEFMDDAPEGDFDRSFADEMLEAIAAQLRSQSAASSVPLSAAIPEGYVLVPQELHIPAEAMEGICAHCGDGGHMFGEFTDGILFVDEVDYGDGKKIYGLHVATADYPHEGCATICEFEQVKGVQS